MGFPGITLDDDGERVDGYLFTFQKQPHLHDHWHYLDDFEGDGYERVSVSVELEDGAMVTSYIYTLKL